MCVQASPCSCGSLHGGFRRALAVSTYWSDRNILQRKRDGVMIIDLHGCTSASTAP